ncbi:hypothetical protein [Clostridium saudiense]|uniref:hypothetical protein n=1 Tax=Clostridium saudiense TaxID=1414720 RepID=UPI0018AA8A20|nr:hypothetical protein [Clostridium saudiense]
MYIVKKHGVIMLEVLILLNILIVLIVLSSKTIVANSSKYSLYEIGEDVLTLTNEENKLIEEVKEVIFNDQEILNKFKSYKDDNSISFEYCFSENENIKLIISNGNCFLNDVKSETSQLIRKIDCIFIENEESIDIIFVPSLYKTFI